MRYGDAIRRWGKPAEESVTGSRRRVVFKSGHCRKTPIFRLPEEVTIDEKDTRPDGSALRDEIEERLACLSSLRPR